MIHFVLCDDDARHNQTLQSHLEQILPALPVQAEMTLITTEPDQVVAYARREHAPTIFLLDLVMEKGLGGLEVCRAIREADDRAVVIYVSAYAEYALDCLETHAFDFVLKPYTHDRLKRAVEDAVHLMISYNDIIPLQVTVGSVTRVLDQRDICYVQTQREYVTAHQAEGPVTWRESLLHLMDRLDEDLFVRIHKSYAVNRLFFDSLDNAAREVKMKDGTVLPIARRCLGAFEQFYKKCGGGQAILKENKENGPP
ncbi:MAG: LytTR family DNA-binding domain-containing protein [Clostridiales bacterium]|nr:LytTR family DNA-binding domain-containing protein [Clostridiales bacterium]